MARHTVTFLIVSCLLSPVWADRPTDKPTKEQQAAQLADIIAAIDSAETIDQAVEAYNSANIIERGNVEANTAYMKKMLTFGKVQYAVYGARWILSVEPDNPLALSVMGYYDAVAGDMEKALPEIIFALRQLPDDESLLHDAGQLVAWLDVQDEAGQWPGEVDRIIDKNQDDWVSHEVFRQAYDLATEALTQLDRPIEEVEYIVEEIRQEGLAIDDEVTDMTDRLIPIDQELYSLRLELSAVEAELAGVAVDFDSDQPEVRRRLTRWERQVFQDRADELRDMIRENDRERAELIVEIRRLKRLRRDIKDDFESTKAKLDALLSDRRKLIRRIGKDLEWRLPAIDGVVIDIAQLRRQSEAEAQLPRMLLSDEANAAGKLQLAKKYLEIDKPDMAVKYLQLLLETFPDSEAADEARQLLDQLQPVEQAEP